MPRYYFVLRWRDKQHDELGGSAVLPSSDAARSYATLVIRHLKNCDGRDHTGLTMLVEDVERQTVFLIPF